MSDEVISDLPVSEPVVENVIEQHVDPLDAAIEKAFDAARDEKGRFTQKEPAAEAGEIAPADAATPAAETAPEVKPAQEQPLEPHPRWSEAEKADFAKLSPDGQKIVLDRYKAMEADYTRKSQDIAELRKSAEPLVQAVQPFQQYLDSLAPKIGVTPPQMINAMLGVEYQLRTGTVEQKVMALGKLASEYGIDLAAMSRGDGPQPTPQIDNLRQTISQLTQRLERFENQDQQRTAQQVSAEITAFENAKGEDGRPKYPHYQRVKGVMAHLLGSGEAQTMEQAYEAATAPIREAVEAELGQRQRSADELNREAVEKARRAQSPRASGTQPNGSAKPTDLDSLLDKALSDAGFS